LRGGAGTSNFVPLGFCESVAVDSYPSPSNFKLSYI
jgi:hypothetical protein